MSGGARRKVVVALPLAPDLLELLGEFDVTYLPAGRSDPGFDAALYEAEGLVVSSNVLVDRGVIESAPHLQVVSTMSVGMDHIDLDAARDRDIAVMIAPVLSDAVADLTLMLMTMLARRIQEAMNAVASGGWSGLPLGGDLAAKTLLLVGFGRIGQAVADRASAAKMNVVYFDTCAELPDFAGVSRVADLATGLRAADFVSLHVDLNPGTRNLIGAEELALMKPTAFLVNTSRGGVVDQVALVDALEKGVIAGAGLDVLAGEPPPHGDPVLRAPNVLILPHIGSATVETRRAMALRAVENILQSLGSGAKVS
jgi:glyoxylate reductase